MVSLVRRARHFRLVFRCGGHKSQQALLTCDERDTLACLHRLEENLRLLERGQLELPPGADLATFLISDCKLNGPLVLPESLMLEQLH
jgi:hypothetical protein